MNKYSKRANLPAAVIISFAVYAKGAAVTVSPEHMQGWVIVTNKEAKADLVNYGPAVYEREKAFTADDGTNLGRGAYYVSIGFEDESTPPSAWLGLDTFEGEALAGTELKRITSLEYYAYNAHIPTGTSNPNHWKSWKGWWTYPKQLIQLQLTAQSPDGKGRKQFWFMPWQKRKLRGENCGRHCKKWLRYDAINFNSPGPNMCGRWFTFGPPRQEFASWADLIKAYGDWSLVPTSAASPAAGGWKSAGWDKTTDPVGAPAYTATGMCLNFVAGARKEYAAVFEPESIRWANDYRGFKGYIDCFTLGIDGKTVTYNFEPAAKARAPKIIELSNKEASSMKAYSKDLVKISGTVVDRTNAMFALDDGSGCVIMGFLYKDIKITENPAKTGERWSVWGHIERVPFEPADGPPLIWTCINHMTKLSSEASI
jgi:RNase P/RNase MRP subunit p29